MQLLAAGQHGLERRDAMGQLHVQRLHSPLWHDAAAELAALASTHPELELEHKGMSLALHYRRAPELETTAVNMVTRILGMLGDGYEPLPGKMVIEIHPVGHDKGSAVSAFMNEPPFKARIPVYIGDDIPDERAFVQVNSRSGHSFKVGQGPTLARSRLADVAAVRAWLTAFAEGRATLPTAVSS